MSREVVCKENTCPLYPGHDWRTQHSDKIREDLKNKNNGTFPITVENLHELHNMYQLLYEEQTIPYECYICNRMERKDMMVEVTASIAKKELLGDQDM